MRYLVLGAGQQGRAVASNLAHRKETTAVLLGDVAPPRADALPGRVHPVGLDATDAHAVAGAAAGVDAAVTLLPSAIGTVALPALVDARVPVVDVSFTPELPFHLDARAKNAGVPVVVDTGIAPGLSHVLAARLHAGLDGLDRLRILVGGLPLDPPEPWKHAVYFNARDLLDEYLRPARVREDGKDVALDPLEAPVQRFEDEEVGALEGFPSDGLRSLLDSFPDTPDMREVTLRVAGHMPVMRMLRDLGLLEGDAADATARALDARFPGARHADRLLMEVHGSRGGSTRALRVHVHGERTLTAMARATAFTAAGVAHLLATGTFATPGVHAPEAVGLDAAAGDALLADLDGHGVHVTEEHRLRESA